MADKRTTIKRSFETISEVKKTYLPSMVRSEEDDSGQTVMHTRETTEQTVRKHLQGLSCSPN